MTDAPGPWLSPGVQAACYRGLLCLRGEVHTENTLNPGLSRSIGKFTLRSNPHPLCHGHGRRNSNLLQFMSPVGPPSGDRPQSEVVTHLVILVLTCPLLPYSLRLLLHFVTGLSVITSQENYLNPNKDLLL